MNYVVCTNPNVRLDLMVEESFYPQLVSYVQRMNCTYAEEKTAKPGNGRVYKVLKDIQGKTGGAVGELLGLFYSLEWGSHGDSDNTRKFYIMINPRRKEKKSNAGKNRKKVNQGSDRGNSGKPAGYSEPEPVGRPVGNGSYAGSDGADDLYESPRLG